MTDEIKITGKSLWPLIKSNIGTIIIIGGLVTNALLINGKKAVDKYKTGLGNDSLVTNQVEIKADIKGIQTAVSLQHQEWTRYINRDSVYKNKLYNGFIVLDTAMAKHLRLTNRTEERLQFMEDQLKKNSNLYDQAIPTPLNINTTSLLKR